jgi:predicted transcriptional regulator
VTLNLESRCLGIVESEGHARRRLGVPESAAADVHLVILDRSDNELSTSVRGKDVLKKKKYDNEKNYKYRVDLSKFVYHSKHFLVEYPP